MLGSEASSGLSPPLPLLLLFWREDEEEEEQEVPEEEEERRPLILRLVSDSPPEEVEDEEGEEFDEEEEGRPSEESVESGSPSESDESNSSSPMMTILCLCFWLLLWRWMSWLRRRQGSQRREFLFDFWPMQSGCTDLMLDGLLSASTMILPIGILFLLVMSVPHFHREKRICDLFHHHQSETFFFFSFKGEDGEFSSKKNSTKSMAVSDCEERVEVMMVIVEAQRTCW